MLWDLFFFFFGSEYNNKLQVSYTSVNSLIFMTNFQILKQENKNKSLDVCEYNNKLQVSILQAEGLTDDQVSGR